VTLTWNGKRFDWVNVAWFAAIHAGALLAPFFFSWTALGLCLLLWWVSGSIGICLTYHRLLTHRGFRVAKPVEYLGTVAGMMASEGGAIDWVAMHRVHHAKSDQPGQDLHTPRDGFLWSHLGWVLTKVGTDHRELAGRYAPELLADPVHRLLNRLHWLPNVLLGFALYAIGDLPLVVWGVFLRLVLTLHGTWFVNSAAHTWGYRTWQTKEDSRNLWWVGLVAWGEGWHNTHHAFQRSARHGFGRELDVTWLAIRALVALGLAKDVHLLPKNAERFRIGAAAPSAEEGREPAAALAV
jgi:stearoyl-CoA desaturase (delta-9 desaturase)